MKMKINILILTLIWFVCGARSCSNEGNMDELNRKHLSASKDSIKQVFEVDSPGDQLLKTYESTAIQKLTDFADYLKIASDTTLDLSFRKQAAEMAGKLFISYEINTRNWSKTYALTKPEPITLEQLLDNSLSQGMTCWVQPIEINVRKPLTRENDSIYKGSLSFKQQCILFGNNNPDKIDPVLLAIDIYTIKKVKYFGKEHQLKVWEVYLGDIK